MDQHSGGWEDSIEHACLSHVGLRRANNQDAMAVVLAGSEQMWQRRGHLFIVADGMGAHAAGELASKLAIDAVTLTYTKRLDLSPPEALLKAVQEANQQIHSRGKDDPEFEGMGTTSTSLVVLPGSVLLAHVGDSRAYRLRGNCYQQLTFDHSLLWEVRSTGRIAEEELSQYVPRNIITRSLGPAGTVEVDLEGPFATAVGDTFLLCSDGLSGPVEDEEMGMILASMPPAQAVQALVDLANLRGGPDNITVIVVRVKGPAGAQAQQPGRQKPPGGAAAGPVHPLVWIVFSALAIATVASAAVGRWLLALGCLGGIAAAGIVALLQCARKAGQTSSGLNGQPLGKGPYTTTSCTPNGEFVGRLAETVQELREAGVRQDWTVDWPRFNALSAEATAATQAGDHPRAIRGYTQLISFMLAQLRRRADLGDSTATGSVGG
jgi:serine/threonine protein phosphatase PrpC